MSRKTCYALDSQDDMLVVLRFLRGVKLACDRAVAPILSDSTLH